MSEKEKIFIRNQALKSYDLDEFSVLQDAFVANVFGLSEKEYVIILKSINAGYAVGKAIKKKVGMPLKFCDMFAGAGGLSYGMELAGYRGVAALELNKFAAASFARNHDASIKTIVGDINDETIQQELFSAIKQGIERGEPWVLVGGPPCQGFSTAGYRNENDIRNKLVDSYLKIMSSI